MKVTICSWNVNGIRASAGKGFVPWFEKCGADLINLQEIRVEWDELEEGFREKLSRDYDVCWFPAASKKGYAGAATLSRKGLGVTHAKGFGHAEGDADGRIVVTRHPAFTLLAGYFPNAGASLERLEMKRSFSRHLVKTVQALHAKGEKVVVVGDLNVAPEELDLANPKPNVGSAGFTNEEREDFKAYLGAGLVDVFRERNPTGKALYTWWSQRGGARVKNVGWRIDMFLVSAGLIPGVVDARIHPEVLGSDHCPISLTLDV